MSTLIEQHCAPLRGDAHRLTHERIAALLTQVPDWSVADDGGSISRRFQFADYAHTMAFVNAVAALAEAQDHHPDLEVGYGRCVVRYNTHDVGGLSLNDFICAAKVDALGAS